MCVFLARCHSRSTCSCSDAVLLEAAAAAEERRLRCFLTSSKGKSHILPSFLKQCTPQVDIYEAVNNQQPSSLRPEGTNTHGQSGKGRLNPCKPVPLQSGARAWREQDLVTWATRQKVDIATEDIWKLNVIHGSSTCWKQRPAVMRNEDTVLIEQCLEFTKTKC